MDETQPINTELRLGYITSIIIDMAFLSYKRLTNSYLLCCIILLYKIYCNFSPLLLEEYDLYKTIFFGDAQKQTGLQDDLLQVFLYIIII